MGISLLGLICNDLIFLLTGSSLCSRLDYPSLSLLLSTLRRHADVSLSHCGPNHRWAVGRFLVSRHLPLLVLLIAPAELLLQR